MQLTQLEINRGFLSTLKDARAGLYDPLAMTIANQLEQGIRTSVDVLGVQFALDATLAVMRQPQVEERLPSEVVERSDIALGCVQSITSLAVERYSFYELYDHTPTLERQLNDDEHRTLANNAYFSALTQAVICDSSHLAGGAHRVLKLQSPSPTEPLNGIIAQAYW